MILLNNTIYYTRLHFLKSYISFHKFSLAPGLESNTIKCKIAGIGILKVVNKALCGMMCLDLMRETVKELDVNFSYNKY